jgi:transposase InsO family protein
MHVVMNSEVERPFFGELVGDKSGDPVLATLHERGVRKAPPPPRVKQHFSSDHTHVVTPIRREASVKDDINVLELEHPDLTNDNVADIKSLLTEFSDIFCASATELRPARVFPHDIDVQGSKPVNTGLRRASPAQREIVQDKVKELLNAGLISESRSPWASAVVLVKKKDGSSRFCVDYRELNSLTKRDRYPLPRIDDTLDALGKSKFFTSLDLKSGYHQIPVLEKDREKTAFITHSGLFEWNVMPFGLCNAPATFQRCMDVLLAGVKWSSCMVYLDDIIVYSTSFKQHLCDLREIFGRVRETGLRFNLPKCEFVRSELLYLGHFVTRAGIRPDPALISKISNFPRPKSRSEVRSFLGLAGYYRRFIKGFSHIAAPLSDLTREGVKFQWTDEHDKIFVRLIKILSTQPVLAFPDFSKPFKLQTDASDVALGAVLAQNDDEGREHPVSYISRKLSGPEIKYDTREKEALAIVWACEVFRPYLIGRHFEVETDHRNLKWLMTYQKPGRLSHWALKLQDFDFSIKYRPGKSNANADTLSRVVIKDDDDEIEPEPVCEVKVVVLPSSDELREKQESDPLMGRLLSYLRGTGDKTPEVCELLSGIGCYSIADSTGLLLYRRKDETPRVVVPASVRREIFRVFHDIPTAGHLGRNKTLKRMKERFYWRGMDEDVGAFIRGCLVCRMKKGSIPSHQGKLKLFSATHPFEMVCLDLLGPFPRTTDGNVYVAVFTDRFTRWIELVAIPDATAYTAAKALVDHIICRHGCPRALLTDRGSNFVSHLFRDVCKLLGVKKIFTTAYHPQTDGPPERLNRFIVNALYSVVAKDQTDWDLFLRAIAFAYITSVIEGLGFSPFEMVYARKPVLPTDVLYGSPPKVRIHQAKYKLDIFENLRVIHQKAVENQAASDVKKKKYYDAKHTDMKFTVGDLILLYTPTTSQKGLSRKLQAKFSGPFEVINCHSDLVYTVKNLSTRKQQRVSVKRMVLYCPAAEATKSSEQPTENSGVDDSDTDSEVISHTEAKADQEELYVILKKTLVKGHWKFLVKMSDNTEAWLPNQKVSVKLKKEWESSQRDARAGRRNRP